MQNLHRNENVVRQNSDSSPDYIGLMRFLLEPFLDNPDSLRIDCEMSSTRNRAWLRIAFDNSEKGKVFGRGGRNIQAIRTAIAAAAKLAGQSVYLDIYGDSAGRDGYSGDDDSNSNSDRSSPTRSRPRRGNGQRPVVRSQSR